jgi:predicted alpha/beta hydrolase
MLKKLAVTSADGACAELILHAPEAARVWLYWCPALGVTARQYRVFAEAMADAGIAVATHEWRGGGSSDRRAARARNWGYRELLDDIAAGVAQLRAECAPARIAIGGHSLGGQLAALALARDPALADRIVLIGSGMPWWQAFPVWQRPLLLAVFVWFRSLAAIFGWFPGRRVGFAGDEARGVIRDWARTGISGRYRADGLTLDFDAALRAVRQPGWAAHLQQDRLAPTRSLRELQSRLPAVAWTNEEFAAAQFETQRATHFSWMKDPQPVAAALSAWLHATE